MNQSCAAVEMIGSVTVADRLVSELLDILHLTSRVSGSIRKLDVNASAGVDQVFGTGEVDNCKSLNIKTEYLIYRIDRAGNTA